MIPIGPQRPDTAQRTAGVSPYVVGVIPIADPETGVAYAPQKQLTVPSGATAMSAAPRGTLSLVKRDGTRQMYGGTATTLEQMAADYTWSSIGTGYTVTEGDPWALLHFGNYLIASNTTDGMYDYDVESPAGVNAVSGGPSARCLWSCANAVFAGDCDGNNRQLRTSAFGNHTIWTTGQGGATEDEFEDGEAIQGGADLANGSCVLFQDSAVRRISLGGAGGAVWHKQKIADGRGAVSQRCLVPFNGLVYFLDTDGFYVTDGVEVRPISHGKVSRTFLSQISASKLVLVEGSVDPVNTMVWWRYRGPNSVSDTVFNDMIGFNWRLQEWTNAIEQTTAMFRMGTPGYTADNADSFGDADSGVPGPDARFWQGGLPQFAGLDENYKLGFFDGSNMAAECQTSTSLQKSSLLVNDVTPIISSDDADVDATCAVGVRDRLQGSITWKTGGAIQPSGKCNTRGRGKALNFKINVSAGESWNDIKGVDHINEGRR